MEDGDFGIECADCECLTCIKSDEEICKNCSKCNGNLSMSKWKMNCRRYEACKNPEETTKLILGDIIS